MMEDIIGLEKVRALLNDEKAQEAKDALLELGEGNTVEYFLLKGKVQQKFQKWGDAINAYNKVLELEPENTDAQSNLRLIKNILNFWNPDLLNP